MRVNAIGRAQGAIPVCPSACAPIPWPAHVTRVPAISSNKQLISINHNFVQLS